MRRPTSSSLKLTKDCKPFPREASHPALPDYEVGLEGKLVLKDFGLAVAEGETSTSKELYKMTELRGLGRQKDFGVMFNS
jgi:hypothetical protein